MLAVNGGCATTVGDGWSGSGGGVPSSGQRLVIHSVTLGYAEEVVRVGDLQR